MKSIKIVVISRIKWTNIILNFTRSRHLSKRLYFIINFLSRQYGFTKLPGYYCYSLRWQERFTIGRWKFLKKMACGLSNISSAHQMYMKYSPRQNSKATLIWTSITYTTTSKFFSMEWLESQNIFFLLFSPSKDNLSLNITFPHIGIALTIILMHTSKLLSENHSWCHCIMTPV